MNIPQQHIEAAQADVVDELSAFYRMEMAAAEIYRKAISSGLLPSLGRVLQTCHASHHHRASMLVGRIRHLGGQVLSSTGVWRPINPFFEQVAATVSARVAVSLMQQSEDDCLRDYRAGLENFDGATRAFVYEKLLPKQLGSHRALGLLKEALALASGLS